MNPDKYVTPEKVLNINDKQQRVKKYMSEEDCYSITEIKVKPK